MEWKAHDSLKVRGNKWHRFSNDTGGYPIDFVMEFYGKSFPEAVEMLIGEKGEGQLEAVPTPSPEFHLPLRNVTNANARNYLVTERGLDEGLVDHFMDTGDIYEDAKYHNVVFVGRDPKHMPRYAHCRGTKEKFRLDVAGSDKSYGFSHQGKTIRSASSKRRSTFCHLSISFRRTGRITAISPLAALPTRPCRSLWRTTRISARYIFAWTTMMPEKPLAFI